MMPKKICNLMLDDSVQEKLTYERDDECKKGRNSK